MTAADASQSYPRETELPICIAYGALLAVDIALTGGAAVGAVGEKASGDSVVHFDGRSSSPVPGQGGNKNTIKNRNKQSQYGRQGEDQVQHLLRDLTHVVTPTQKTTTHSTALPQNAQAAGSKTMPWNDQGIVSNVRERPRSGQSVFSAPHASSAQSAGGEHARRSEHSSRADGSAQGSDERAEAPPPMHSGISAALAVVIGESEIPDTIPVLGFFAPRGGIHVKELRGGTSTTLTGLPRGFRPTDIAVQMSLNPYRDVLPTIPVFVQAVNPLGVYQNFRSTCTLGPTITCSPLTGQL